jgi:4,5-dihydroxyphthalate decarboxylase
MTALSRRRFVSASTSLAAAAYGIRRMVPGTISAAAPTLALTCANYVRFMPLAAGDARSTDLDLTWIRGDRTEMLRRATEDAAVDGGETSMAQHVMRLDAGDRSLVAVPVFPLRNFTARDLYTRKESTLDGKTLGGKRIGIYNWAASGAVWYRHLIRWLGHDVTKITWVVGGPDAPAAVRVPEPRSAHVTLAPQDHSLSDLLLGGRIDAFFAPLPPQKHHALDGPIVRVFPAFPALEQRYFADTRCYPPQHVVVIRRSSWARDPSVGRRLVDTCNDCESRFEAAQRQYPYNSPWLIADVEDAARLMGTDYHAHGFEKNRHAINVFCQSAFDDGLTKRRVSVEDFFQEFRET